MLEKLKEIMARIYNVSKLHRTENTRSLDERFDADSGFRAFGALGRIQYEEIGEMLLRLAKKRGHFVAVPVDSSSYFTHYSKRGCSVPDALEMAHKGYLVAETVAPDLVVVSPSEKLAEILYR